MSPDAVRFLNADEQKAMDAIGAAMAAVQVIGPDVLVSNRGELVAAVHVLQSFVSQHALYRVDPQHWSAWYHNSSADTKVGQEPDVA